MDGWMILGPRQAATLRVANECSATVRRSETATVRQVRQGFGVQGEGSRAGVYTTRARELPFLYSARMLSRLSHCRRIVDFRSPCEIPPACLSRGCRGLSRLRRAGSMRR